MQQRSHINQMKLLAKQQGATLITSLILLLIMTIVGVSAVKVSSTDTMIASNDMQQMILHQETENTSVEFSNTAGLFKSLDPSGAFVGNIDGDDDRFKLTDSPDGTSEIITNTQRRVDCNRGGSGTSIGLINCWVYDFEVRMKKNNSSAKDKRHRGMGKAVPTKSGKGSIL